MLIKKLAWSQGQYLYLIWKTSQFRPLKKRKYKESTLRRTKRHTIMLNHRELNVLNAYCKKYKISNKSKFMREAIMTTILKKLDDDYPSLFAAEPEPNLFNRGKE